MVSINFKDPRPIYEQIKSNLRNMIVSGAIPPNYKLPSVREMASDLSINPNTIQRAYRELENEGYICTVPGKGCFTCEKNDLDSQKRIDELLVKFEEITKELCYLGFNKEMIINKLLEGEFDDQN